MPQPKGRRQGRCLTCGHPEVRRIEFLLASGSPHKAVARRFGVSASSVYQHWKNHVSLEYKASLKIGPIQNEEHLRLLCVEVNTSVLERHRAAHAALTKRWMAAFEAEADSRFCELHGHMRRDLEFEARLTRELLPPSNTTTIVNNVAISAYERPEYIEAINRLREALRPFPEARKAAAEALRALAPGPLIEHQAA